MKNKIKINDKIEIISDNTSYKSSVQDILDDSILIYVPISGSRYYIMHIGSRMEFYICNDKEITKYGAVVLGKRKEGNIFLIELSKPVYLEQVQRREFFRLPILLESEYLILPEKGVYKDLKHLPKDFENNMNKSVTVDISGGGLKIITKYNCPKGSHVVVTTNIPEKVTFICTVVRSDYDNDNKNYKTALRMEVIDERDRDKIIRFIFAKAREYNKLDKDKDIE